MYVCIYIFEKIYIQIHILTNRPHSGALNLPESHRRALLLVGENAGAQLQLEMPSKWTTDKFPLKICLPAFIIWQDRILCT